MSRALTAAFLREAARRDLAMTRNTEENGANLDQMTYAEVDMLDLMHPLNWEDGVHRSKNVR